MIDVDAIMDTAITGVETVFGRQVLYSVGGTAPAVELRAHYVRQHEELEGGIPPGPGVSTTRNIIDFRRATLDAAGITPRQGDTLTMRDGEVWRVLDVQPGDVGTVYLVIGRRAA